MEYWKIKHTGWFNPKFLNQTWSRKLNIQGVSILKVLNQTWRIDNLNIQSDSIRKFWNRYEVLTSWTYRVIPSISFEADIKYWQIKLTGWFHPNFDPDMKYWQIEHTGWFNPKVWARHEVMISCTYNVIPFKSCEPDLKYWQIEHMVWYNLKVLNQTRST